MKFFVRAMSFLLAALMVLGMAAAAMPRNIAYAASKVLVLGTQTADITATGTPSETVFDVGGVYKIEFTAAAKVTVTKPSGVDVNNQGVTLSDSDKKFLLGGVTVAKANKSAWVSGDTLTINVKEVADSRDPAISFMKFTGFSSTGNNADRNRTNISRVTRGTRINALLTVQDTNFDFSDVVVADLNAYVTIHAGAFSNAFENTISQHQIRAKAGTGNKLSFEIDLVDLIYSGYGNVVKLTYGYTVAGKEMERTLSVTVPNTKEYTVTEPKPDDPDPDDIVLDPLVPHIIVDKYSYGSGQVVAGQFVDLSMQFTNTSSIYGLHNIVMKVTTGDGFSITSSSNSYYIQDLSVGQSISQVIGLQANPAAKAQSYPITIEFTFQYVANDKRLSGTSSESISIPVSQPDRFQINELQLPEMLYTGDEFQLSLGFVNKGKAEVYNVSAELKGNMPNAGERSFIGTVATGTEESADFYLTPSEAGVLEGEILISYEDSNMNVKEVSRPFKINVEAMDHGFPQPNPDEVMEPVTPEKTNFWNVKTVLLGSVGLIVAALTAGLTILKIKAKRSDFTDEVL